MYYIEYDYTTASAIHEQRLREAEIDRVVSAIRSAREALRSAARRAESFVRVRAEARPAA